MMLRIILSVSATALLALALQAAPAQAQGTHTFVSAFGDDPPPSGGNSSGCARNTPCRTFQGALGVTTGGGEITVLDPGGYGGLTINKPISIVNDSAGEASILVGGGGTGITVNAPNAYINLRGITIQGNGTSGVSTGLQFTDAFALTLENCVIRNHTGDAIFFAPQASSNLSLSNTLLADNGGNGINIHPNGGGNTANISLKRVEMYNNSLSGLFVFHQTTNTVKVSVADSVAGNNGKSGFAVLAANGASSILVQRSVVANNGTGLAAFGGKATLRVGQSTITGNTTTWWASGGGTLRSYGDNNIDGNADGDPPPTTIVSK